MKKAVLTTLTACCIIGSTLTGTASAKTIQFTDWKSFLSYIETHFNYKLPEASIPNFDIQKPESDKPDTDVSNPETNQPGTDTQKPETNVTQESEYAQAVLNLVNSERAKQGLSALTLDSKLSAVATNHSADMAKNNYFSHTNLSGKSPFDRIKEAGISYGTAGENIAAGQKTPSEVVNSWMNSEGHRKNILNGSFKKMGLGYVKANSGYKTYWTQIFTD